jgi:uncharacterized membrane-anchored protein
MLINSCTKIASEPLGYEGGAVVFAAGLAVVAAAYFYTKISHTLLFGRRSF